MRDLSTRFSGIAAEQVDAEVDGALARVVEAFETDRSTLLQLHPESGAISVTHSWARPGIVRAQTGTRISGGLDWYHARLREGEPLRFERLPDELPRDALAERALAARLSTRSQLAVPLSVGGRWVCALLMSTTTRHRGWDDDVVDRLRIVGQILANAVHRRNLEFDLRSRLTEVRRLQQQLEAENRYHRETTPGALGFEGIAGRSRAIRGVIELAAQVAPMHTAVLLLGETGTGKELLARAIHARSPRAEQALIKVNCAALPPSLVESELFGHEKGAFTGATSPRPGRFELADGGTLFLDEIGEVPPDIQAKLLRVLEEGAFERVGGVRTRKVDVRILAATNRDLERAMVEGGFREDLYYRLSAFPIRLPPLRDRREDIPPIVWDLIQRRAADLGRRIERVPESVFRALARYSWPGNVRELANVIERAMILSPGSELQLAPDSAGPTRRGEPADRLEEVERAHIQRVLDRCHWRISGVGNAAEVLGLRPSTLRSRLKKLGVRRPSPC